MGPLMLVLAVVRFHDVFVSCVLRESRDGSCKTRRAILQSPRSAAPFCLLWRFWRSPLEGNNGNGERGLRGFRQNLLGVLALNTA